MQRSGQAEGILTLDVLARWIHRPRGAGPKCAGRLGRAWVYLKPHHPVSACSRAVGTPSAGLTLLAGRRITQANPPQPNQALRQLVGLCVVPPLPWSSGSLTITSPPSVKPRMTIRCSPASVRTAAMTGCPLDQRLDLAPIAEPLQPAIQAQFAGPCHRDGRCRTCRCPGRRWPRCRPKAGPVSSRPRPSSRRRADRPTCARAGGRHTGRRAVRPGRGPGRPQTHRDRGVVPVLPGRGPPRCTRPPAGERRG